MTNLNKTDLAVADFIDSVGVSFAAEFQGDIIKRDWTGQRVNHYRVLFRKGGQEYFFPFYQGLGIEGDPTAASVLYCLLSDMLLSGYSVQDYLDEFEGVSEWEITVQRQAEIENLIEECESTKAIIEEFFTEEQIEHLRELLEDY